MKYSRCFFKSLCGFLALSLASLAFTAVADAAYLYWDPIWNNGNGSLGTATWDMSTSNWFNGTSNTDVAFSTFGSNDHAVIGGYAGEMDLASGGINFGFAGATSGPALIVQSSWGSGIYTFGAAGATDPLIFNPPASNNELISVWFASDVHSNVLFNAPVSINIASASAAVYGASIDVGSANTVTFAGGISVGGMLNPATLGIQVRAANGATIILDGSSTVSGGDNTGFAFGAGGNSGPGGVYVLPATASLSGYQGFEIRVGTLLVSTGSLGGGFFNVANQGVGWDASLLTAAPVTIGSDVRTWNNSGVNTIGGSTADHSIFTGQLGGWTNSPATLTAAAGGQVDFNGQIWGGTGTITKGGSGTVVFGYTPGNTYNGATEIQSGTLLLSNTAGSATGSGTNTVMIDNGAALGGTGISTQQIVAAGALAVIAPGATNSIGTLHLNGGLVATSGLRLKFDVNSAASDALDFGTAPLALSGSVAVIFSNAGSVSPGSVYHLFTGSGDWSASSASFALVAPPGYVLDSSYGGGQGYIFDKANHDFSVKFMATGIGAMIWTPRSDWRNIQNDPRLALHAAGDGITDDTAAIQAAFDYLAIPPGWRPGVDPRDASTTIYFPPGVYRITSTLALTQVFGVSLIGCGSSTIFQWAGAPGQAMIHPSCTSLVRYVGLVWDGMGVASCAYEHAPLDINHDGYESQIRHENESFLNFTVPGSYPYMSYRGVMITPPFTDVWVDSGGNTHTDVYPLAPAAGIVSGFPTHGGGGLTADSMVYNCRFYNCTTGFMSAWDVRNYFMWDIEGCEFDNCGTGINCGTGGGQIVTNCHFQQTTGADVVGGDEMRLRHCTSVGSGSFFYEPGNSPEDGNVLQDCLVDGWTNVNGAIILRSVGPDTVMDCCFTNPPSGALGAIKLDQWQSAHRLILSNNYAPDFPDGTGMINGASSPYSVTVVPPGVRGGTLTSATQTFLNTNLLADGTCIIDVTQPPYNVENNYFGADAQPGIQAAIDAARIANNGSIVYIPTGIYRISGTLGSLNVTGSNYSIQGAGITTELCWYGGSNTTAMQISNAVNLSIKRLRVSCLENFQGDPINSGTNPVYTYDPALLSDPSTITCIHMTATGPGSIIFDDVTCDSFPDGNRGVEWLPKQTGLVLDNLPKGSTVFMKHVVTGLSVKNCGEAQILAQFLQNIGTVSVSGTGIKTGFLGAVIDEGGWRDPNQVGSNIAITDNQDLVIGDYYTEQCGADLYMERGSGTGAGRVTIGGINSAIGSNHDALAYAAKTVNINNYAGRLFYGFGFFGNDNGTVPVCISQTGTNAVDMILAGVAFVSNSTSSPSFSLQSGAHLIETQNLNISSSTISFSSDTPNPLTLADLNCIAQSFDHIRQLGAVDLQVEYGITNTDSGLASYWKQQHFTAQQLADPAVSGDLANPSGDGMSNLMKYALNLDPNLPDAVSPTTDTVVVGGTTYFCFTHRQNTFAPDLSFHYERSSDLLGWIPATPEIVDSIYLDPSTNSVTAQFSTTGQQRLFLRLRVSK